MKPIRFSLKLILLLLLAACAPATPTTTFPTPEKPTELPDGVLLEWQRMGGIAGFCDKVVIDAAYRVSVYNCRGEVESTFSLTETQHAQLDVWLETYQPIEFTQSDPAVTDAMTVSLTCAGRGEQVATDEVIQSMLRFASELAAQAR